MWTKRFTSHNPEFPNRADVIRHLLQRMVEKKMIEAWVHLALVEEGGWFNNLLSDWIDLSFTSSCSNSPTRKLSGWIEGL
jgi:hypothetical protein